MKDPRFVVACMALLLLIAVGACGDSEVEGGPSDTAAPSDTGGAPVDDIAFPGDLPAPDDGGNGPLPDPMDLDFTIAFSYLGRVSDNLGQSDLWLMGGDGNTRHSVTDFVRTDPEAVHYTCGNACVVDDSLTRLAVATGPRQPNGYFQFALGSFDTSMRVSIEKAFFLDDVVDLRFAGPYLYYTKFARMIGESRQFEVYRVPVAQLGNRQKLFDFPPEDRASESIFQGRFFASPDGETLLFLVPTIRSQSVYTWRDGALDFLGEICSVETEAGCTGDGSQYSDADPAAISPDGRFVAVFVVRQHDLRLYFWDLTRPNDRFTKELARVPFDQSYVQASVCQNLQPGQVAFVRSRPRFAPDSQSLLFLGRTECGTEKPMTDIMRLTVDRILDPTPLAPGELDNLTRTADTGDASQVVIDHFDISPGGDVLVLSGSPMYELTGEVIPATSRRQREDREVWVENLRDPQDRRQLTNEVRWSASAPRALPPVALP